jgi:hypothetical protein
MMLVSYLGWMYAITLSELVLNCISKRPQNVEYTLMEPQYVVITSPHVVRCYPAPAAGCVADNMILGV